MIETEPDPHAYSAELKSLLVGELAPYAESLLTDDSDRSTMSVAALLDPATLRARLTQFEGSYRGQDFRAITSLWSAWYFAIVIPLAIVAIERARLKPALDLKDMRISTAPDGTVNRAGIVPARPTVEDAAAADIYEQFVCEHIAPVISALHRVSRLSTKVLWANAAATVVWTAGALMPIKPSVREASILRSSNWPNGERNEILRFLKPRSGSELGLDRRVCCLRYRLRDHHLCRSCPIAAAKLCLD